MNVEETEDIKKIAKIVGDVLCKLTDTVESYTEKIATMDVKSEMAKEAISDTMPLMKAYIGRWRKTADAIVNVEDFEEIKEIVHSSKGKRDKEVDDYEQQR